MDDERSVITMALNESDLEPRSPKTGRTVYLHSRPVRQSVKVATLVDKALSKHAPIHLADNYCLVIDACP